MNTCQSIERIIKFAESEGNTICSISKSELMDKVIWMNNALSPVLKNKIKLNMLGIEYEKTNDRPHDPGTECFICNECKILVAFPLNNAK